MTIHAQLTIEQLSEPIEFDLNDCQNIEFGPNSVEFQNVTFQFPIKSFYETHANDDVKLLVDRQLFERPLLINADITLHNRVLANAFVKGQENNVSIYGNYAKLIVQSIVILDTSDSVQESVMSDFVNSLFAQGNLEATIDIEREGN